MKTIQISTDEALVLFEWLSGSDPRDTQTITVGDAEAVALGGLLCALEKILTEPFNANYQQMVVDARTRLASNRS